MGKIGTEKSESNSKAAPGSSLSKEFSSWLEKSAPDIFRGLGNAQNMGNAAGNLNPTARQASISRSARSNIPGGEANTNFASYFDNLNGGNGGSDDGEGTIAAAEDYGNLDTDILTALKTKFGGTNGADLKYDAGEIGGMGGAGGALERLMGKLGGLGNQQFTGDTDYYKAVSDSLANKQRMDIADTRSRFANTGMGRGTGGAWAESLLRSQQAPEIAQALGGVRQQEVANQINMGSLNTQGILGGLESLRGFRGQNIDNRQRNIQNLLAGGSIDSNNLSTALGNQNQYMSNLGNYRTANRGMDADMSKFNVGTRADLSKFNAGQGNDMEKLLTSLKFQGNEGQMGRQLQGLLALLESGMGLSGLGFDKQTKNKGRKTEFGADVNFNVGVGGGGGGGG